MKTYDVIIIGGGMIGASLALALQPLGLRIAVVEAIENDTRTTADFDARSIALSYGSRTIFESMGIWQFLQSSVTPIKKIHVSDKGYFGATRLCALEENIDALGYVIEAQHLTENLLTSIESHENITWFCPATLETFTRHEENIDVKIMHQGAHETLRGALLVGADGAQSKVRQHAQIDVKTRGYDQHALVANIGLARLHHGVAYERFTPTGPLALLPMTGQRSALVWTQAPSVVKTLRALPENEFLNELQQAFGYRLGKFIKVGKRFSFPLQLVKAQHLFKPGIVLLGNAAHALHPIAGQGFNLGLRDVATLAECLHEARLQNLPLHHRSVLQDYAKKRERDQRHIIQLSDYLPRLFSNTFLPAALFRDSCLLAVDRVSPIKKLLMRNTMGVAGRVSDLNAGISYHE